MTAPFFGPRRPRKRKVQPGLRWEDEARFIRTWLESPKTTGAVSPSGRFLSRTMARCVDPAVPGPVIELGPGTGPVTDALIRRGVAPERLVLVEFDASFCRLLARRYPGCTVVQGDAYALARTLRHHRLPPAAAVVSSLPLLNRPDPHRIALFHDALDLMAFGSPFVQFTYGLVSPIPRQGFAGCPPIEAHASAPVWLNLPPARVWTYRLSADATDRMETLDIMDRLKLGGERLGEEWREQKDRLRAEFLVRSAEAKAEWKARAAKVKLGLSRHGVGGAAREQRAARGETLGDKRRHW